MSNFNNITKKDFYPPQDERVFRSGVLDVPFGGDSYEDYSKWFYNNYSDDLFDGYSGYNYQGYKKIIKAHKL